MYRNEALFLLLGSKEIPIHTRSMIFFQSHFPWNRRRSMLDSEPEGIPWRRSLTTSSIDIGLLAGNGRFHIGECWESTGGQTKAQEFAHAHAHAHGRTRRTHM